jgi:hypothetical protein
LTRLAIRSAITIFGIARQGHRPPFDAEIRRCRSEVLAPTRSQNGYGTPLMDGTKIDLPTLLGKSIFQPEQGQQQDE